MEQSGQNTEFKRHVFEVQMEGGEVRTMESLECQAEAFKFSPVDNGILLKFLDLL